MVVKSKKPWEKMTKESLWNANERLMRESKDYAKAVIELQAIVSLRCEEVRMARTEAQIKSKMLESLELKYRHDTLVQQESIHEAVADNYRLNQVIIALNLEKFKIKGTDKCSEDVCGLAALFGPTL